MVFLRFAPIAFAISIASTSFSTCGQRAEGPATSSSGRSGDVTVPSSGGTAGAAKFEGDLPGVDASALTPREKREWKSYVSEMMSPCQDTPVSIAQCVKENRSCSRCLPAARFLVKQVRDGRTREQAIEAYRLRFDADKIKSIDLSDTPSTGTDGAPVTVVEWADFECGFCKNAMPAIEAAVAKFPGKVKFYFKNYPLAIHENAETAARAAVAADRQGKFWPMHHKLFESKQPLKANVVEGLAKELGLKVDQLKTDMASDMTTAQIARDKKQAESVGFEGTPTIFINGRRFVSNGDFVTDLEDWLQIEVELNTGGPVERAAPAVPPKPVASPDASGSSKAPAGAPSK
jgi:protein-disulfide isomerase